MFNAPSKAIQADQFDAHGTAVAGRLFSNGVDRLMPMVLEGARR